LDITGNGHDYWLIGFRRRLAERKASKGRYTSKGLILKISLIDWTSFRKSIDSDKKIIVLNSV
jgi:hypothetical protein